MTISPFLVAGAIGFVIAYLLTPAVGWLAKQLGVLDHPGGRHIHRVPVPRLGGLAIYLAFVAAVLVGLPVERPIHVAFESHRITIVIPYLPAIDRPIVALLLGATLITLVGAFDDIRGTRPLVKLIGQIAAAAVLLPFGVGMDVLTNPLGGMFFVGPLGAIVTVVWIVALCNVMNLIDGVDGLASGIAAIAGTTLLVASYHRGDVGTAILAAALAGGALGFIPYNFNPARIFLGDTGSMLLGYLLGALSVLGTYKSYTALSLLVALAALGVPVTDTAFAIARRWRNRRPIFEADTQHLHHRLMARGLTPRQTTAVLYLVTGILSAGALMVSGVGRFPIIAILGLLLALLALGARKTGLFASSPRAAASPPATMPFEPVSPPLPAGPVAPAAPVPGNHVIEAGSNER
ncbi:MAG TPA: MraY family glycosyltransferase [bacterium]|nr:MraY family glycosyltransferase [bacterium]